MQITGRTEIYKTELREYTIDQFEESGSGELLWYSEYYGPNSLVGCAVSPETIKNRIDSEEAKERESIEWNPFSELDKVYGDDPLFVQMVSDDPDEPNRDVDGFPLE